LLAEIMAIRPDAEGNEYPKVVARAIAKARGRPREGGMLPERFSTMGIKIATTVALLIRFVRKAEM
jgi:hypothetical protein